ncbi:hypothetical protein ABIB68_000018 [Bradyrhizobium sp. F1.2.2]
MVVVRPCRRLTTRLRASRLGREYRSCHKRARMALLPLDPRSRSVCRPAPDRPTNRRYCPSRCGRLRPVTGPVVFPQHEQSGNFFLWTQYFSNGTGRRTHWYKYGGHIDGFRHLRQPQLWGNDGSANWGRDTPSEGRWVNVATAARCRSAKGRCGETAALFPGFKMFEMKSLRLPGLHSFPGLLCSSYCICLFAASLVGRRRVSFGTSRSENLCYAFPKGVRARHGPAKESTGATRPAALSELPHHDEMVSLGVGQRQHGRDDRSPFRLSQLQRSDAKFTAIGVPPNRLASPQLRVVRGGR